MPTLNQNLQPDGSSIVANAGVASAPDQSKLKQVNVVATTNTPLTGLMTALPTIDGVPMTIGKTALLPAQTTGTQNGRYVLTQNGSNYNWVRANDTSIGEWVYVLEGTAKAGATYKNNNTGVFVDGTTTLTYTNTDIDTPSFRKIVGQSVAFILDLLGTGSTSLVMQWQDKTGIFMQIVNKGRLRFLRNLAYNSTIVNASNYGVTSSDINIDVDLNNLTPASNIACTINLPAPEYCENGATYSVGDFYGKATPLNKIRIQSVASPFILGSTVTTTAGSTTVNGTNTKFTLEANKGMIMTIAGVDYVVASTPTNDNVLVLTTAPTVGSTNVTYTRYNPINGSKFLDITSAYSYATLRQPSVNSAGQGWIVVKP
jgi:hypothetical protein